MATKLILATLLLISSCHVLPQSYSLPTSLSFGNTNLKTSVPAINPIVGLSSASQLQTKSPVVSSNSIANIASNPSINFNFPNNKLVQAGSVFQTTTPIITTTSSNTNLFSNSSFGGFSNAYKSEMAFLIASIKDLNTSTGKLLTDKLTMSLISIDNTLKLINMNTSREVQLKPLLQYQVKTFLSDIDRVQEHLESLNGGSVVTGNSNLLMGRNSIISGNNNAVIGNTNAVVGSNNGLIGNQTIISGYNNGVVGNNGVTIGLNNQVNANNSYVFSSGELVNKDNTMVVGDYSIDLDKLVKGGGSYIVKN